MTTNNRMFRRLPVSIESEYRVQGVDPLDRCTVRGKNVSAGGVCMVLSQRLDVGTLVELSMHLPNAYTPVRASARVAWCDEVHVGAECSYDTGFAFTEFNDEGHALLTAYLETAKRCAS